MSECVAQKFDSSQCRSAQLRCTYFQKWRILFLIVHARLVFRLVLRKETKRPSCLEGGFPAPQSQWYFEPDRVMPIWVARARFYCLRTLSTALFKYSMMWKRSKTILSSAPSKLARAELAKGSHMCIATASMPQCTDATGSLTLSPRGHGPFYEAPRLVPGGAQ